jgi:hypothetical protein
MAEDRTPHRLHDGIVPLAATGAGRDALDARRLRR